MSVNKPVKFEFKANHTYFLLFFLLKKRYISHIKFVFHSKNSQIKYIMKLSTKKKVQGSQINSKGLINLFEIL